MRNYAALSVLGLFVFCSPSGLMTANAATKIITQKPLPPTAMPKPVVNPYKLTCTTTSGGGEFPQIVFKNIGTKQVETSNMIIVKFSSAPGYSVNPSKAIPIGASINMPLPDNNGKPHGSCTASIATFPQSG